MAENRLVDRPSLRRASTLIASILCWIWGVVFGYQAIGWIPTIGDDLFSLGVFLATASFLIALANCAAGCFLLREPRVGVWMGMVIACLEAVALLFLFTRSAGMIFLGIGINLVAFALLTMNWVDLRDDEQEGPPATS